MDFSSTFKSLRIEAKMTQSEIANALDISKSTVAMWETGNRLPSYELLEAIADFFNVDMGYLLGKQNTKRIVTVSNNYNFKTDKLSNEIIEELAKLDERKQVLVLAYLKAINDV